MSDEQARGRSALPHIMHKRIAQITAEQVPHRRSAQRSTAARRQRTTHTAALNGTARAAKKMTTPTTQNWPIRADGRGARPIGRALTVWRRAADGARSCAHGGRSADNSQGACLQHSQHAAFRSCASRELSALQTCLRCILQSLEPSGHACSRVVVGEEVAGCHANQSILHLSGIMRKYTAPD